MRALLRRKGVPNWPHGHGYGHGHGHGPWAMGHVHGHGHQFERVQIVLFFCLLCAAFLPVWGKQFERVQIVLFFPCWDVMSCFSV